MISGRIRPLLREEGFICPVYTGYWSKIIPGYSRSMISIILMLSKEERFIQLQYAFSYLLSSQGFVHFNLLVEQLSNNNINPLISYFFSYYFIFNYPGFQFSFRLPRFDLNKKNILLFFKVLVLFIFYIFSFFCGNSFSQYSFLFSSFLKLVNYFNSKLLNLKTLCTFEFLIFALVLLVIKPLFSYYLEMLNL